MMQNGLIHIYYGDGKGKTTAAVGLAVRAAGSGKKILVGQFFKDGSSSEIRILEKIPRITVQCVTEHYGRYANMDNKQRDSAKHCYSAYLSELLLLSHSYDVLILDEIFAACRHEMVNREELLLYLSGEHPEVILTGRDPDPGFFELADYITEMRKIKHPFDKGIAARKRIEG